MGDRQDIPDAVCEALRREAGFGCCVCGNPIIQYHHIRAYATAVAAGLDPHEPEHMMIVCPTCHALITNGSVSEADQRRAKRSPKNIRRRRVDGPFRFPNPPTFVLGTCKVGRWFAFALDDTLLLAVTADADGRMELSARMFDGAGRPEFVILRNE